MDSVLTAWLLKLQ